MAKRSLTMTLRIEGARETLNAFRGLPKEASAELRDRAQKLAEVLAPRMQAAARSDRSPQARLIAPTIRARRDRVPVVVAGGAKRVGRRRVPAYKVLFGSEFGANRFLQFQKKHQGQEGSFLFPVAEQHAELIEREWNSAADEIIAKWSQGGAR